MGDLPSKAVIGSYVFHEDKAWYVSTIYRQSSSPHCTMMYYETLIWEWDSETKQRGRMAHQLEGLESHFGACREILRCGAYWDRDAE